MLLHRLAETHRGRAAGLAMAAAVAVLTAAGCGTTASAAGGPGGGHPVAAAPLIVIHDDANGATVQARAGDRVELILSSSYWDVAGSSSPRVLRQDGPEVLMHRPSTCPNIPGLGCTPVQVSFIALGHGRAVITARRGACGEALPCLPDQTRFTVTVVVT